MTDVAIVDYGVGNLLSVRRAFDRCGAVVAVTSNAKEILSASRVVLPGVGAFADGMAALHRSGLDVTVKEAARRMMPLLGICLGMQMLFEKSEEFGVSEGLGLIAGRVVPIPNIDSDGRQLKIPHIGWSGLSRPDDAIWAGSLLEDVVEGEAAYFVHSFMAAPASTSCQLGNCTYGGLPIAAVVTQRSVSGCQFHPEKSGEVGLRILRRFLRQPLATS